MKTTLTARLSSKFPRLSRQALLGAAAAVLIAASPVAAEPVKIKVGHLVALDMAPLFVAQAGTCFKDNNLDVETVFFANPGDNNAALAGGAIDVSINPFTLPFFAANSGIPIRVVAAAGGWGVMEVIADKESGLKSMADLKAYVAAGKPKLKIATLQGDTLELILTREFEKNGIATDAVELVYFNDLLAMVEAFRTGEVDILSHIKPYTTDLVASKGAAVLTTNASAWSAGTPNTVVSVLDKTLTSRPEVVESYLKAMICSAKIINEKPDTAVELLSKGSYFRVKPDVLLASFKSAPAPISFVPDVDAVQSVVTDLTKLGYVKGTTSAADIFRLDMIKSLEGK
ncbi:ABC transporter substrate-binding protein [Terrihabitans rhizophilus]|uniref:ABC transporter substrate-binding protein n=1 Tax=Terrihabitans rhizophilus TaxID=3092662 RepID=A0ABU4RLQ8_9HYPH|nr:ABC transporter substrate-binding protein [Terrihabitans sp. PJ23]MDX6804685.1 ABC transporter substrate-binding protein [Terrihabitans sp. PJ23]